MKHWIVCMPPRDNHIFVEDNPVFLEVQGNGRGMAPPKCAGCLDKDEPPDPHVQVPPAPRQLVILAPRRNGGRRCPLLCPEGAEQLLDNALVVGQSKKSQCSSLKKGGENR
jgi:hypothetical protein